MLRRCLLSLILILTSLVLNHCGSALAEGTKTGNILIVSSGRMATAWPEQSSVKISAASWYFALGTISITLRESHQSPMEVAIWGRGFDDIAFFELPLPAQVLADAHSVDEIRKRLLVQSPMEEKAIEGARTDLEKLQKLVAQAGLAPGVAATKTSVGAPDAELQEQRQVALNTLRALGLQSLDQLWALHGGQQDVSHQPWAHPLSPSLLAQTLDPKGHMTTLLNGQDAWPQLLEQLNAKQLLTPVLRTTIFSPARIRTIGYLVRLPNDNVTKKAEGEILVAAKGSEPEKLGITLEIERESLAFGSLVRFLNSFFPTLTTVFTTLVGVWIGFAVFQLQQRKLREIEEDKKFEERKFNNADLLTGFFDERVGNYRDHREANREDADKAKTIRLALIEKGIYRLLPEAEKQRLTAICDGPEPPPDLTRTDAIDQLLRKNFREFIVSH
jgi:hypothetical protein